MYFVWLIQWKQEINIFIFSDICLPSQNQTGNRYQPFPQKRQRHQNIWESWWTSHLKYSPDWRGQRENNMVIRRRDVNSLKTKALLITVLWAWSISPPWIILSFWNNDGEKQPLHAALWAPRVVTYYSQWSLLGIPVHPQYLIVHNTDSNQLLYISIHGS